MASSPNAPLALLAGGGTGGHVFPALAIAHGLEARGWRVMLVGGTRGLEARLAAEHGVPFHALPAEPFLGHGPVAKLRALATLARSARAARNLVAETGAKVLVGTGGYAAAPALLGGWLAGRHLLLLEPNARAGLANRGLSYLADEALIAFERTASAFACPSTVTGVPIRRAFFEVPPRVPETGRFHVLVLGGSQGSRQLNELLPPALARLAARTPGLTVVHQCGAANVEAAQAAYDLESTLTGRFTVTPFLTDVAGAMAEAELIVSRAGALTVTEIAAAGRPALFLPLAIAGAHQYDNARALVEAGAAVALDTGDLTPAALADTLLVLAGNREQLAAMGEAARRFAPEDALERILERVEHWAAEGVGP
jgi:UDP-N-acetylglucosamine--N-acetylmuramyl-(pentapeptide) pyrophosphoryl-undecaprenol N-acetylglucosamine transferase